MVSEVGYDDETKELTVTWTNGRRSAYAGVPEGVADQLARAPSVGTMLNSDIKPYYSHRYIG
jgi:hypothetical protein